MSSYLFAHFAKSQLWHASTLLFGFFLTEACGLSMAEMSLIMAASLVLNGAVDAGIGRRWRTLVVSTVDAMRRQAWGAPVTCLFFLLVCATPFIAHDQRLGWALFMLLGFRASYPFLDVPQNAVVALAGFSVETRQALLAKRNIASGIAGLAVGGIAAPLLVRGEGPVAWLTWATCLAVLACGSAWWLARTCRPDETGDTPAEIAPIPSLSFGGVLAALAVMMAAGATFRTLEPYQATFAGRGMGIMVWAATGGLASQFLWFAGRRRVSAAGMLVLAALVSTLASLGLAWPSPLGSGLAGLGFGIATGWLWLALWTAMMTHAAAGGATGYVGTFTCVSKLAQAAAMLLIGRVMARSPYRVTLVDPGSPPSLLMPLALLAIASTALALAFAVSRTGSDGKPAPPRPAGRQARAPAPRRPASS